MPDAVRIKEVEGWFRDEPPMLSIKRSAFLLSCSERQIHRYIRKGLLATFKFGTGRSMKRCVPKSSLIQFVLTNDPK